MHHHLWYPFCLVVWLFVMVGIGMGMGRLGQLLYNEVEFNLPKHIYQAQMEQYYIHQCPEEYRDRISWLDECRHLNEPTLTPTVSLLLPDWWR